jgi:deazaflavin-dependent oxidoreductase (nitroreductase family)
MHLGVDPAEDFKSEGADERDLRLWTGRRLATIFAEWTHIPDVIGATGEMPSVDFKSRSWRAGNTVVGVLARPGVGPFQLLTTRGRQSGRPHTNPVVSVELDGKRWLVAPYGPVDWVRNARKANRVQLRYGRSLNDFAVRELEADEAGPVLKRYVAVATKTRSQFHAGPDEPVAAFVAEAASHPVFELIPVTSPGNISEGK